MLNKRIAIIRISGGINLTRKVKDTFKFLRLYKKHSLTIVSNTPSYVGMINMIKDHSTWGELDKDTFRLLLEKRGRLPGNTLLTNSYLNGKLNTNFDGFVEDFFSFKKEIKDIPGLKPFFRLSPPLSGFERKGIKKPFLKIER